VFAICVKTGIIFKMGSTSFSHVSVPNIYGTSPSTYLIIFLKVISKVLFFNITQKFTNLLVQLVTPNCNHYKFISAAVDLFD